ncbi:MAG TPA: response regulator [Kofleriaceae bacterium]|nr:response regulator [Kofleriaceae bacterium]
MTRDVLVIDDSATVRKLVEISLRGRLLRAHFADSGAEGLRTAFALRPSAILLDFMLPDMTGVEVCRALAADPRTQSIPILVVSAKHERVRAEFQPFPSVVDFLGKPFAPGDLIARIDRAIAGASGAPVGATPVLTGPVPTMPSAPLPVVTGSMPTGPIPTGPIPTGSIPTGSIPTLRGEHRRDPGERAAKLLFARLRDGLALLPSQFRSLEPGPIAPQLAKRLLTPQVVEGILADLRPLVAELIEVEHNVRRPDDSLVGPPPPADSVIDRVPGFSARVQTVHLSSLDRRILAHADGRSSIAEIARRIAADPDGVSAAVRGLIGSGLVHEIQAGMRPRPVVICEPDVESFQEPLRSLLARRATSRELIAVERVEELVGVARQRQPCLVMVNATSRVAEVCAVAQTLRADLALSDLAMVAVLEARVERPPDLLTAGFDAVLAKPVMVNELERFLIPADLR